MQLRLKKPLVFFDLETTGLSITNDRIIEICLLKINIDNSRDIKNWLINPQIPISEESINIHGITNEKVNNKPLFKEIAEEIINFIKDCDLAGYNLIKFDIPLLAEELLRSNIEFNFKNCHIIDVQNIFHKLEKRTLEAAYKFYCNKLLENAHSAKSDTIATYEILLEQIKKYDVLSNNVDNLSKFSNNDLNFVDLAGFIRYNKKGVEVFSFGKYKNISLENIWKKNPGYFSWIKNAEFPVFTKIIIDNFIKKMKLIEKFKE